MCSSSFDYFKLGLGANPLRCDCDVRWLHELLRNSDPFRLGGLAWTCDDGRRFAELTAADFAPCPQPPPPPNCSAVVPPDDPQFDNSTTGSNGEQPLFLRVGLVGFIFYFYKCT